MNLALHGRKLSAAIILTTLMLSALFLARGATNLIAGSLLPPQPIAHQGAGGPVQSPPGAEPPDPHEILKRNIFDPTTGALWPPKVEATTDANAENTTSTVQPEELVPGQTPPPCEGSTKVLAALYSERFPEWSFASLSSGSDAALLYREGSHFDEKDIVSILPKGVFFRQGNGRLCSVLMFAPPQAAHPPSMGPAATVTPPPAAAAAAAAIPGAGGISEAEMDANIHALSETKFQVKKSFVDKILTNQAAIMSSARIVPHEENGAVVGVKLYGIRRNSLLGKLGLQNGDLLRTINGFEMSSPDTALEAYARLRSASNLSLAVVRRGTPTNMQYDINE